MDALVQSAKIIKTLEAVRNELPASNEKAKQDTWTLQNNLLVNMLRHGVNFERKNGAIQIMIGDDPYSITETYARESMGQARYSKIEEGGRKIYPIKPMRLPEMGAEQKVVYLQGQAAVVFQEKPQPPVKAETEKSNAAPVKTEAAPAAAARKEKPAAEKGSDAAKAASQAKAPEPDKKAAVSNAEAEIAVNTSDDIDDELAEDEDLDEGADLESSMIPAGEVLQMLTDGLSQSQKTAAELGRIASALEDIRELLNTRLLLSTGAHTTITTPQIGVNTKNQPDPYADDQEDPSDGSTYETYDMPEQTGNKNNDDYGYDRQPKRDARQWQDVPADPETEEPARPEIDDESPGISTRAGRQPAYDPYAEEEEEPRPAPQQPRNQRSRRPDPYANLSGERQPSKVPYPDPYTLNKPMNNGQADNDTRLSLPEKEIPKIYKNDLMFSYIFVRVLNSSNEQVDVCEMFATPIRFTPGNVPLMIWVARNREANSYCNGKNMIEFDCGDYHLRARGRIENKQFHVSVEPSDRNRGYRLEIEEKTFGSGGHVLLQHPSSNVTWLHICPVVMKNNADGYANYFYCIEDDGRYYTGDNSAEDVYVKKNGDYEDVICRWTDDGYLFARWVDNN